MNFRICGLILFLFGSCAFADKILQENSASLNGLQQDNLNKYESELPIEIKSNIQNMGTHFSASEVKVLSQLSERRNKILQESIALKNKESSLKAIEHSIEKKIRDLVLLKEQIEKENLALQSKDDEKVKSLVKIYENMNPKRAAQIFDEIELETLMQIICSMKEIKVSAILANMEISKAKELSVALTKRTNITKNNFKIQYE
jgi:flagellar motility protein MotE (MotC chaperone)